MGPCPPSDSCPDRLVHRDQWVGWRTQERDGKETKVPVNPATGRFASATDSETWTDFETAREHATTKDIGIGFVFTRDDPIVGVDLDDCRDPDDGTLEDWAHDIVARLDSFTEVSPSGTGVHVLVEGELPEGRNRHGDVELYDDARFFTVTGDHLSETPQTIEARQDALTAVHAEYVAQDTTDTDSRDSGTASTDSAARPTDAATSASGQPTGPGNDLDDETLLSRARDAANGDRFERLWRGQTTGYPSQSEADMALCSMLAFWTGGDPEQMDRLFRESGLMRPKWDEQHFADGATYGERTIERAISGSDEFYTGSSSSSTSTARTSDPSNEAQPVTRSVARTATEQAEGADETMVPKSVVDDLNAELQRLERENESLRAELATERERRQELEAADSNSEDTAGLWATLLARLS
jgi:putative DNA primase/helicase